MPILLPHEVYYYKILAKHMGVKLEFNRLESGLYKWVIRGYCPFYDSSTRSCRIHGEKPLACRMFPLLLDISENKLMVSSLCSWVKRCLERVKSTSNLESAALVFPGECEALLELLTVLYGGESIIAVAIRDSSIDSLLKAISSECTVIKTTKSSVVEDLYLILLSNCTSDFVEKTIDPNSLKFLIEEKLARE
jgi:Fe-S-cluster containining protein